MRSSSKKWTFNPSHFVRTCQFRWKDSGRIWEPKDPDQDKKLWYRNKRQEEPLYDLQRQKWDPHTSGKSKQTQIALKFRFQLNIA